jgi:outer membrane lipoprotein-sorting protein
MKRLQKIEEAVKNFCLMKKSATKTTRELDEKIIGDALQTQEKSKKLKSAVNQSNIWRIIMQSKITKYAVAAVILIAVMLVINYPDTSIDGASTVFAAAIDHVKQARTFSCIKILELAHEDGENEGTRLFKSRQMFKEPNLSRYVKLASPTPRVVGETTITDYDKLQRLVIYPDKKIAVLSDISYEYHIDPKTGKLIQKMQLDTRLRDRLLKLTAQAVEDLGTVKLNGQLVRKLQSTEDSRVITFWIDPETNFPVQIEFKRTNKNYAEMIYTEIHIDTELDNALFSLEPPEGYDFHKHISGWSDTQRKISTKIKYLSLQCVMFASENNGQFPKELTELKKFGIKDQILRNILTSEDQPDGPVLIQYHPPRAGADSSPELILYEIFNQWPQSGIVAGFTDGHAEIISSQTRFEELIK